MNAPLPRQIIVPGTPKAVTARQPGSQSSAVIAAAKARKPKPSAGGKEISISLLGHQGRLPFFAGLFCLIIVLVLLFYRGLRPEQVLFNNDLPIGAAMAKAAEAPGSFWGVWMDTNWLGNNAGSHPVDVTFGLLGVLGPVLFAKFYAPLALLVLGLSAWLFFRQARFSPTVCWLGSLAATLNMNFFSSACWGLGSRALCAAFVFAALAAIQSSRQDLALPKLALGGLALGMAVMEGADNGAIFSLYVAAFVLFVAVVQRGPIGANCAKGLGRLTLVALCAGLIAAQALVALVSTSIQGVASMQQTRAERWEWATQWSLPKVETLRVVIPGLFGYRMDPEPPTPPGGQYWGSVGQTPGWAEHHQDPAWRQANPQAIWHYSGAGEYAGILVVLIGFWALVQSFRRLESPFDQPERQVIWFWGTAAVVSLLLAFGRHAPFYQIIYALPYLSTIRNPLKFMHPFHLSLLILFGYGLQGLWRRYLARTVAATPGPIRAQWQAWWAKAGVFEKNWIRASILTLVLGIFGGLVYSSAREELVSYLRDKGVELTQATAITRFSAGEVGWFIVFLGLALGLMTLVMSGVLAGRRMCWAWILIGLLLGIDLARANVPWIKYWDYQEKYATNPIIERLRQKPYEQRVAVLPFRAGRELAFFQQLYSVEWLQHLFPFFNIQSLDVTQEPRMLADNLAYRHALTGNLPRLWQLTNTRFLFGMGGSFADALNQQLDPAGKRFRVHTLFTLVGSPSGKAVTAQTNGTGPFALLEFTGALPRARLYAHWQVSTNDQETLKQLASPNFDPEQTVLVASQLPAPTPGAGATSPAGRVEFSEYAPKQIHLQAQAGTPTVLLLNDKFDPAWKVRVDGRSAKLLRANFLMRGVYLPAGSHQIEFRFKPPQTGFYLSLAALALGVLLCCRLIWWPSSRCARRGVKYTVTCTATNKSKGKRQEGHPSVDGE